MEMDIAAIDESGSFDEALPGPPAPLSSTRWVGRLVIVAGFWSVPGFFAGDFIGLGLVAATWCSLVIWSALVVANARRARPSTSQARAPRPTSAALSWFLAPAVAVASFFGLVAAVDWVNAAAYEEQDSRSLVLAGVVCTIVVAMFAALYRPYGILARTARWVNVDGRKVRKWFAAPFLSALCSIAIQLMASLIVVADVVTEGSPGSASIGALALIVVSLCLPWLAWLVTAQRAITAIESGIAHAHARAEQASRIPQKVSPNMAAYMQGATGEPERAG